ncbi:MAG TPA: hypothetical protein DCY79_11420 [Planctomycetaceae bacterium]|nr:hypothetical protein [Planctomycetaceae bacterium]
MDCRAYRTPWRLILTLIVLSTVPITIHAHPVSISRSLVYLTREQATAKVEVFLEDLFLFHNLKPNSADFLDTETLEKGIELHKKFVSERFTIQGVDGQPLKPIGPVRVTAKIPDEGVALAELMAHKLTFELDYEFPQPPEFLTFKQRFTDEAGILPSEMNLQVKQQNAGVAQSETLIPHVPHTMRFSWDAPPLAADASQEEWDAWFKTQQQQTLGITSYSQVYSFLYINDYEVRHEILIPLLTLEQSVLLARDDDDFLSIAEQDAARKQVEAYFQSGNPIEVDGQRIEPVVQRCDFFGLDFKDFAQRAERKQVPMVSARVGIILSYPLSAPPQNVQLTWNRFNQSVYAVSMTVFAYDEASRTTLTRIARNNVYHWNASVRPPSPDIQVLPVNLPPGPALKIPLASITLLLCIPLAFVVLKQKRIGTIPTGGLLALLCGSAYAFSYASQTYVPVPVRSAPIVTEQHADTVFRELHGKLYRAFQYQREEEIYDALSTCIDGDLLRDVYLQVQQGLKMQEQGGAISRIQDVQIIEGHVSPDAPSNNVAQNGNAAQTEFTYQCQWHVVGTVEHWGHIHERTNAYRALFTVAAIDGHWKVTQMSVLDEERVQFETRLRSL